MRHPVVPLSDVPLTEEAHDAAVGLARQARRLSPPLFVDGVQEVPQRRRQPDRCRFFYIYILGGREEYVGWRQRSGPADAEELGRVIRQILAR